MQIHKIFDVSVNNSIDVKENLKDIYLDGYERLADGMSPYFH